MSATATASFTTRAMATPADRVCRTRWSMCGPDGLTDAADRTPRPAVPVGELPPAGDDPGRVGAEVGHVDEVHGVGVRAERGPQRPQPGLRDGHHYRFLTGKSVPDERHHPVDEVAEPGIQDTFVP